MVIWREKKKLPGINKQCKHRTPFLLTLLCTFTFLTLMSTLLCTYGNFEREIDNQLNAQIMQVCYTGWHCATIDHLLQEQRPFHTCACTNMQVGQLIVFCNPLCQELQVPCQLLVLSGHLLLQNTNLYKMLHSHFTFTWTTAFNFVRANFFLFSFDASSALTLTSFSSSLHILLWPWPLLHFHFLLWPWPLLHLHFLWPL